MTQSIVSINSTLIDAGTGVITSSVSTQGAFDGQITVDSQQYYLTAMQVIKDELVSNGSLVTTTSHIPAMQVQTALAILSTWATTTKYVDPATGLVNSENLPTPTSTYNVYDALNKNNGSPVRVESTNSSILTEIDSLFVGLNSTMSSDMATALENFSRMLASFGYSWNSCLNPSGLADMAENTQLLTNALTAIHNAGVGSAVVDAINGAITAAQGAHVPGSAESIQEIVMTNYVAAGNQLLYDEMSNLQTAIRSNEMVLAYCNSLQDLMNQKEPEKFTLALDALNKTSISDEDFNTFEADSFARELRTTADTAAGIISYAQGNQGLLRDCFRVLRSTSPSPTYEWNKEQLVDNLDYISGKLGTITGDDTGALANLKNAVINLKANVSAVADLSVWVKDFQTGGSTTGDYQRSLTNAITSSQSFNDTARENLRNVMFIFQEFYQSATTLLSRMTQTIEKMASMMSRQ